MGDLIESAPVRTLATWGMNARCSTRVLKPRSEWELAGALAEIRTKGVTAGLRGAGCSYGDAPLNSSGLAVDTSGMRAIHSFDPDTGVLDAEPGVTIEQVWRRALPRGYWPPVVPGTMFPTLGGCAAMNIHGKNHFKAGALGRYVRRFRLAAGTGEILDCSPSENPEIFRAAIGGFGLLGAISRIELDLRRVHSGDLWVKALCCPDLESMIATMEEERPHSDYMVGWVDVLGGGRGLIHRARYLEEGEDESPGDTLSATHQELPSRFFLVIPKGWLWMGLWCFFNKPGMRLVNHVKYASGCRAARGGEHRQSLVGFSFLLDYVPRWKYAYKPRGFIQYQAFVPKEHALAVFREQMALARRFGIAPFLGVLKRHRAEPDFLLSHAVDGYSLALDFPLPRRGIEGVLPMTRAMDEAVVAHGGRFYLAKDSTLGRDSYAASLPAAEIAEFRRLKRRLDPDGIFQSDLSRRLGLA